MSLSKFNTDERYDCYTNFMKYVKDSEDGKEIPRGTALLAYLMFEGRSVGDADLFTVVLQSVITLQSNLGSSLLGDTISSLDELVSKINFIIMKIILRQDVTEKEEDQLEETVSKFSEVFVNSVKAEVQKFLTDPKSQHLYGSDGSSPKTNELLAIFVDFLLEILWGAANINSDEGQSLEDSGDEQRYVIHKELTFLFTILGDKPFQFVELEQVKFLLAEIEKIAIEVGCFIHSCLFEKITIKLFGMRRDAILNSIALLNQKIKLHCIKFSEPPRCVIPSAVPIDSLFIINSLIKDLENMIHVQLDFTFRTTLLEELKASQSVLENIEVPHEAYTETLFEIRDFAYEAEYLINSHVVDTVPDWYFNLRINLVLLNITRTRTKLQEIWKIYGDTKVINDLSGDVSSRPVTSPTITDDNLVVGFEDNVKEILHPLVRGGRALQVISIVGMPGVGKTTTTKKLYGLVSNYFDRRAWCVVSQTYQKKKVLIEILMSLNNNELWDMEEKDDLWNMEDDDLGVKIYKNLCGRRYLIVIDDVWNSSTFDDLKRYFPDTGCGSRIMLTSRNKNVVPTDSLICTISILSDDQSWELLEKKVFQSATCPPHLVKTEKALAANCRGLPLAIVVIAGILKNLKAEEIAWERVKKQLDTYLLYEPSSYKQILELSYEHLPNHLKLCFLYLGVFPKSTEIPIQTLRAMWIAERFIKKEKEKSQEDVAEEYIADLINRSLLVVAKRKSNGGIKTCSIHDLLRDMCVRKADEENFMKFIEGDNISWIEEQKRLCVRSTSTIWRNTGQYCRTFVGHHSTASSRFSRMTLLRVMDMQPTRTTNAPLRIDVPIYLRYLVLDRIPNLVEGSFVDLEFLSVKSKFTKFYIPPILLKMVKLRHLRIESLGDGEFREDCDCFQTNNLEYLSVVLIKNDKDAEIIKCSPHLRRLKCKCDESIFPDLCSFTNLESLTVEFNIGPFKGEIRKINFPSGIKQLHLTRMGLSWGEMSIIGELPNLRVLKLGPGACEGEEWITKDGEFEKLNFLKIEKNDLKYWSSDGECFPNLQMLVLSRCEFLLEIPEDIGYFPTLHTIEVSYCNEEIEKSAASLAKEQLEYGNEELKVVINKHDKKRTVLQSFIRDVENMGPKLDQLRLGM